MARFFEISRQQDFGVVAFKGTNSRFDLCHCLVRARGQEPIASFLVNVGQLIIEIRDFVVIGDMFVRVEAVVHPFVMSEKQGCHD